MPSERILTDEQLCTLLDASEVTRFGDAHEIVDTQTSNVLAFGRAVEAAVRQRLDETERGWLIEHAQSLHSLPSYLTTRCDWYDWTSDSLRAIRFARREDADAVAGAIGDDAGRVCEHVWDAARTAQSGDTAKGGLRKVHKRKVVKRGK
jgi:hypothetical protein